MHHPNHPAAFDRVTYPGELGIPLVGLSFELPVGWSTAPVEGALAVCHEPAPGPNGFRANIVASIDRVGPEAQLAPIAAALLEDARDGSIDLAVQREGPLVVGGVPAVLRQQAVITAESAWPLAQSVLVLLTDVGGGAARDCIQLTGTVEEARGRPFGAMFRHVVESLVLDA